MVTAIVGKFTKGRLLRGRARKIIGYRFECISLMLEISLIVSILFIVYYVTCSMYIMCYEYIFRCEGGILSLKFSRMKKQNGEYGTYRYEETTSSFITSSPKLMDPYEKSNIYIAQSKVAGKKTQNVIIL